MPSVCVIKGYADQKVAQMFASHGWSVTNSLSMSDLICFTGGSDLNPRLYGEQCLKTTSFYNERDEGEMELFKTGRALNKAFVGICRGGQFLNVMNGGRMVQDTDNHTACQHPVAIVGPVGSKVEDWRKYICASDHHQQMVPGITGDVLAVANKSTYWAYGDGTVHELNDEAENEWTDPEVILYKSAKCLCYQPHPEMGTVLERAMFFKFIDQYLGLKGQIYKDSGPTTNEQGVPFDDDIPDMTKGPG